jgi:hypothetical protein
MGLEPAMSYVLRDGGAIIGMTLVRQFEGQEFLDDTDPELIAFRNRDILLMKRSAALCALEIQRLTQALTDPNAPAEVQRYAEQLSLDGGTPG